MTDETSKPPEDAPVTEETTTAVPDPSVEAGEKPDEAKPKPTDEEKAAKIAAAKAKAAAKKAAEAAEEEAEPKPPWEDKPVSPERIDAGDDPEVVALAEGVEGSVLAAGRFAGDLTVTIPAAKIVDVCQFSQKPAGLRLSRRSHGHRLARARRGPL